VKASFGGLLCQTSFMSRLSLRVSLSSQPNHLTQLQISHLFNRMARLVSDHRESTRI
jgi:hypothetical protein